jgi:hypothetical protein
MELFRMLLGVGKGYEKILDFNPGRWTGRT